MWAIPSGGALVKDAEEGSFFAVLSTWPFRLAGQAILLLLRVVPLLIVESAPLACRIALQESPGPLAPDWGGWVIQLHALSTYSVIGLLWCKAVIDELLPQCHLSQSNKFSLTCIIFVGSVLENPDQCIDCSGHQWLAEWLQWRDWLRWGIDGENAGKRSLEQVSLVNFKGIFPIYLSLLFVVLWSDPVYARQMSYLAQQYSKKSWV